MLLIMSFPKAFDIMSPVLAYGITMIIGVAVPSLIALSVILNT